MPDTPAAELLLDEAGVRGLLHQADGVVRDAGRLPLRRVASGWDCDVWRLGEDLAVRLPRRLLAAPLIRHEASALPLIAPGIEKAGLRVPLPVFLGAPDRGYPWPWSIVPWIDGVPGLLVPRAERAGWAEPLALALLGLHVDAPSDHPENPFRGVPLSHRADAVDSRWPPASSPEIARARALWDEGLAAEPWCEAPVWIHGDLHPGNLVATGGALAGIIDFGDVTAGDPAYDLAIAWLAFDESGRTRFRAVLADRYDEPTWVRARAWAAADAMMLLTQSDDEPLYRALGTDALREVTR